MPICDECGTDEVIADGRCELCGLARTHAALEDLIRTADSIMRNAEAAKRAALEAQYLLVVQLERRR